MADQAIFAFLIFVTVIATTQQKVQQQQQKC